MIPIRDPRGRVIGFGGRILGEGEPKYLNSPDTPLFDKGRTLYNLDRAGPASRTAKRLIVVEGYMDVIALDRAGIAEVVAPNGTARHRGAAGAACGGSIPRRSSASTATAPGRRPRSAPPPAPCPTSRPDRTLRFVELPAGQDPDDVIQRRRQREAFEALLANPEPLDARLWRHELEAEPLTTPEAWAGLKQRLIAHAAAIGHPDLRRIYREDWLNRFYEQRRPASLQRAASRRSAAAPSRTAASCPPDAARRRAGTRHRRQRHRCAHGPRPDPRLRQFPGGTARPLRAACGAPDRRQTDRADPRRAGQRGLLRRGA